MSDNNPQNAAEHWLEPLIPSQPEPNNWLDAVPGMMTKDDARAAEAALMKLNLPLDTDLSQLVAFAKEFRAAYPAAEMDVSDAARARLIEGYKAEIADEKKKRISAEVERDRALKLVQELGKQRGQQGQATPENDWLEPLKP